MSNLNNSKWQPKQFEMEMCVENEPTYSFQQKFCGKCVFINKDKYCKIHKSRMTLKTVWKYRDKCIMLKILVMCLYISDVFSDICLALEYFINKQYFYAMLTLVFVWIPSMFVTYDSYRRKSKLKLNNCKNISMCLFMVLIGFEPVLCYFQSILYAIKLNKALKEGNKREITKYYEKMVDQNRDVVDLKLYEGCMEAVPQLILQLSIILRKYDDMKYDLTLLLQVTSMIFSLGGLALTIITWIQAVAVVQHCRISALGLIVWSTGRLSTLVSRVLSITGSASIHPGYTAIGLIIHWFGATLWHYYLYKSVYQNVIVSAAVGVLNSFLSRVDNIINANVSQTILTVEDVTMMTIWVVFSEDKVRNGTVYIPFLTLNITSCILGVVVSTIYMYCQNSFMNVHHCNIQ